MQGKRLLLSAPDPVWSYLNIMPWRRIKRDPLYPLDYNNHADNNFLCDAFDVLWHPVVVITLITGQGESAEVMKVTSVLKLGISHEGEEHSSILYHQP